TDNVIPAQLVARGTGLNTSSPTYYALSVTRGVEARLLRVQNGVSTTLAYALSAETLDPQWVRIALSVQGSTVKGQIYRLDTNQYLAPGGRWQNDPAWLMTAQDSAISGSGQVGFARPPTYPGAVYFDDLRVFDATGDPVAPTVSLISPA